MLGDWVTYVTDKCVHVIGRHRHPSSGCGGPGPQAHFLATVPRAAVSPYMSLLHNPGTSLEPGHSRGPQTPPPALSQVGEAGSAQDKGLRRWLREQNTEGNMLWSLKGKAVARTQRK